MAQMKRDERIQAAIESVVRMFETGNLPEKIAQTYIQKASKDVPSASWSLGNQLIMLAHETTDARGYRQWQAVGRQVRKATKAFYILAPITRTFKEKDPETGEEQTRTVLVGFREVPVFKIEDTEGEPLEPPTYNPPTLPPLYNVAQRFASQITYVPFVGQAWRGEYRIGSREIRLATHDVSTFFHELGHAAHATFRALKGGQQPEQEIVAETVAATLCHLYGFDGYLYHGYEYIRGYAGGDAVRGIMRVLADVQKTLDLILGAAEQEEELGRAS